MIEAAGGVLWRHSPTGEVEIALVHRPRYDDWSIPKGKLRPGESPLAAGLREIREETGFLAVPGRPLGELRYLKDGEPKRVRYWSMEAREGEFRPTDEVDQLRWLTADTAAGLLPEDRDAGVLAEFTADTPSTRPCVVVRHASAGKRGAWAGPDDERPLDPRGTVQANALGPLIAAYEPTRLVSSGVRRCVQTVAPLAAILGFEVTVEPLFSEAGFEAAPGEAVRRLVELAREPAPLVICSQGDAMPDLIWGMCAEFGVAAPAGPSTAKGGFWVFHLSRSEPARLVDYERFDPPELP